jgi:hypothetical protein
MRSNLGNGLVPAFVVGILAASAAVAKVPPEKAKELDGPKYTCYGAERAGTPSGVAAYTGKYLGTWPGQTRTTASSRVRTRTRSRCSRSRRRTCSSTPTS